MVNTIINKIEIMLGSPISIKEKRKVLLELQSYINKNLNALEKLEDKQVLETYLKKYEGDESENAYTLEDKYEVNRDFQDMFVRLLDRMNIDGHGIFVGNKQSDIKKEYQEVFNQRGYENDIFYIRPYNWDGISYSDCSCGLDDKLEESGLSEYECGFHSKDCTAWNVNFYYKPTNLKIEWYKYPLRSAFSNQIVEKDVLRSILNDCINSI